MKNKFDVSQENSESTVKYFPRYFMVFSTFIPLKTSYVFWRSSHISSNSS